MPPPIPPEARKERAPTVPVAPLDLAVLHELPSLELRARYLMDGLLTGLHRSPKKGFSVDFAEHRNYQLGDDLRHIDWRLFGRSDRLHIKQYEHETQLRVILVLDTSASMGYSSKDEVWLRKIDFARSILAAIGLLSMRQGDAFGLALIGQDLEDYLKPRASLGHWRTVLGKLDGMGTGGNTGLARGLTTLAGVIPRRSLVVVASDFYEDSGPLEEAGRRLRFDQQELVALHTLDPMELELNQDLSGTFTDAETGERLVLNAEAVRGAYLEKFSQFLEQTENSIRSLGGDYSLLRTDHHPMKALGSYLACREQSF